MFVIGYFLKALADVLNIVLYLYLFLIIARAVISWISPDPWNPIVRFVYQATEPLLERLRERLPLIAGGIDFSPFVVILTIVFLQQFLVNTLARIAHYLIR